MTVIPAAWQQARDALAAAAHQVRSGRLPFAIEPIEDSIAALDALAEQTSETEWCATHNQDREVCDASMVYSLGYRGQCRFFSALVVPLGEEEA